MHIKRFARKAVAVCQFICRCSGSPQSPTSINTRTGWPHILLIRLQHREKPVWWIHCPYKHVQQKARHGLYQGLKLRDFGMLHFSDAKLLHRSCLVPLLLVHTVVNVFIISVHKFWKIQRQENTVLPQNIILLRYILKQALENLNMKTPRSAWIRTVILI